MTTFKLPDLGEGLQDAEIVSWHVSEGDHVVQDQPLVSVETAKAVVEIPSPQAGRIARTFGNPGDVVETGADLVRFEDTPGGDPGAIVGTLPGQAGRAKASPAVRQLAAQLGVNLAGITGSGPAGSITKADIENAAAADMEGISVEKVSGVRRAMAQTMTKSGAEIVPATVTDEADIGDWTADTDVTIRLVQAIAAGIRAEPGLNAWYYASRGERWLHERINLGLAVDTPDGLFVPTLRDIGARDRSDLREGLQRLRADVAARSIPPEELRNQTITLSNFGMIAGLHAALVIVPPQVAIVGAGRIFERPYIQHGEMEMRRFLPLSLTFDHRVVTGGEAARFLAALIAALQQTSHDGDES
jgi:pyruvate dehydrogenase E2 component (dihydrolipoamide acetyltransferase)